MSEKKISLKAIKIGFLGDKSVGKSAICNCLMGVEFSQDTLSTIGSDKLQTKFSLKNGKEIKLILWDTAGQERFRSIALNALKVVQGIILVFDVTNRETFDNVTQWLEQIKDNLQNPFVALFGNKTDMPKDKWKVTTEEAKEFAQKNKLEYFETSAKLNEGIKDGVSFLVNEIYDKMEEKNKNIVIGPGPLPNDEYEEVNGCFGKKKRRKKKNKAK